jgi:two-component system chemotaxis response regulator CheB
VVLTGMGADGAEGAREVARAGGEVWAESEETAVIYGMPQEAVATGAVSRVLPLGEIGPALVELARKRR